MTAHGAIAFFDSQFQQQIRDHDFRLNPFELTALPHLKGRVLDFGCGMGNLAMAAAQRGCSVLALDGSQSAIRHLRQRAVDQALPVEAVEAELRTHEISGNFDCVISIGLLMFFDCARAARVLAMLQSCVREGGIAVINTLIEGTTWLDMFQSGSCCLFAPDELECRFAGWNIIHSEFRDFDMADGRIKSFATLIARKPAHGHQRNDG